MEDSPVVGPPQATEIRRSSRDPEVLRRRLEAQLALHLPVGADPSVSGVEGTSATGMSSDTILFDAAWTEADHQRKERLVARIAPDLADVPVFPGYDMARQFEVIRRVGELTSVPVPGVWWSVEDPAAIGAPFFVMERVDGQVPPDVLPYNFGDSWLYDAAPEDRARMQEATVQVLAELHAVERPEEDFAFLAFDDPGDTSLRRHVAHARAWYDYSVADGAPSPLVERVFAWLEGHWPDDEGPTVLSWGDSRIGNVMYRDFQPVGVFDWEMAGLGPRELDLAWLVYAHRFFEDLAAGYGLGGMPDFLRPGEVIASYEAATGYAPRNVDFHLTYAAVQFGIVGLRTGRRAVHFGEREMPDDPDDLLLNRPTLERIVAEGGWD